MAGAVAPSFAPGVSPFYVRSAELGSDDHSIGIDPGVDDAVQRAGLVVAVHEPQACVARARQFLSFEVDGGLAADLRREMCRMCA